MNSIVPLSTPPVNHVLLHLVLIVIYRTSFHIPLLPVIHLLSDQTQISQSQIYSLDWGESCKQNFRIPCRLILFWNSCYFRNLVFRLHFRQENHTHKLNIRPFWWNFTWQWCSLMLFYLYPHSPALHILYHKNGFNWNHYDLSSILLNSVYIPPNWSDTYFYSTL